MKLILAFILGTIVGYQILGYNYNKSLLHTVSIAYHTCVWVDADINEADRSKMSELEQACWDKAWQLGRSM